MAVTGTGYQAVEPPEHNHFTRDIKPRGVCPACDVYCQSGQQEQDDLLGTPLLRADASDAVEEILCPECHGDNPEGCDTCLGQGFIDV